ncbi:MAG TPA: polysaccharide biosynthesis tyrosine autokinase [Gaiellaceae bacterium]|nr:polysaccharide biosynthesis tyrosine autokinase [Gaiellaceae bacterium]
MTQPYSQDGDQVDEGSRGAIAGMTVRELIGAVVRRRWLVAAVTLLVVAVGVWRTVRQPRIYRAATTVRIEQPRNALATQPTYESYDPRTDPLLSEQQVIRSQTVAAGVADRLGLRLIILRPSDLTRDALFGSHVPVVDSAARGGEYELRFGPATYSLTSGGVNYGSARYGTPVSGGGLTLQVDARPAVEGDRVLLAVTSRENAALAIRATVGTKVLPQTNIVEISYEGTDPALVRDVANAVALEYQEFSNERQRSTAREKSRYTRAAVDSQAIALQVAQDRLEDFKRTHRVGNVVSEREALESSIRELESQQQAMDVERRVYAALVGRMARADTSDEDLRRLTGTDAVTKNTYVASLFGRWFDLEKQHAELRSQGRTETNDDVRAVRTLISRTKADLQVASEQYLQAIDTRIQSTGRKIQELRSQLELFPPLEAEESRLMSNVKTAQDLFVQLQSSYQVNRINESDNGGTVQLLDPAPVPRFAVSPNRKRDISYSLVLGLLLGIGLAILLERLDDTVKTPDELRDRLDVPVVGLIPAIDMNAAEVAASESTAPAMRRLATHADPRSPVAEAYRSLRTNLAFARTTQALQTIVVASPGPGDGKSTTAANLAITFAQQGQRTLLIDADLRRAVLDKTFGLKREPGLTDVIIGTLPLSKAVHETQVPNLFVLPSGQFPPNPSELLGSPAMREVLRSAKEQFDVVLFDSPPLLAVTDAAVLSTMADGTILVVRTAATAREAVRRAVGQLRAVHGRLLGAVLNDVDVHGRGYYGGYGYYYYSYYGAESNGGNGRASGLVGRVRRLAGR